MTRSLRSLPAQRTFERRPPAVAGTFYPDDPAALRRMVDQLLRDAAAAQAGGEQAIGQPKALIAPHAGYPYSGPIAASAYVAIEALRACVQRVVLIGPAHRVAVAGLATSSASVFETPLGDVPVDREAVDRLTQLPEVRTHDLAHAPEHGLEVHLPFLLHALGEPTTPERGAGAGEGLRIVPLLFGQATEAQVARVLAEVWGGRETLIVVSSDLSHFHDYETARRRDRATAAHILAGDAEAIGPTEACGHLAIRGLMRQARTHCLHPRLLDLRSSGDTAGPHHEVVGYGSFLYC
ncbi:MAG: AmmeMemoRadiSam system protein B [Phycisphaeraceae bacterium]